MHNATWQYNNAYHKTPSVSVGENGETDTRFATLGPNHLVDQTRRTVQQSLAVDERQQKRKEI